MMWQTQTTIEYPFALRPASIEEAGLFYPDCPGAGGVCGL